MTNGKDFMADLQFPTSLDETCNLLDHSASKEIVIPPPALWVCTAPLRYSTNSSIDWPILGAAGSRRPGHGHLDKLKPGLGSVPSGPVSANQEKVKAF